VKWKREECNMKGRVSVIIPAYNVESYLDRCLESVTGQSYQALEIIIVNDGSTDATGELCEKWRKMDSRVQLITQENSGLSAARNTGLTAATGEYIFLVDSDDWIATDTLQKLMDLQKETGADLVCCGVDMVFEDGSRQRFTESGPGCMDRHEAMKALMTKATICSVAWNKLYKRSLFAGITYPVGKLHEDEFTTYKLVYNTKLVAYTDECFYHYFQRDFGLMGQIRAGKSFVKLDAIDERTLWLQERGEDGLAAVSLLKAVEYVKCLYRSFENPKEDGERQKALLERYKGYLKPVMASKEIPFTAKIKTIFWRYALPYEGHRRD